MTKFELFSECDGCTLGAKSDIIYEIISQMNQYFKENEGSFLPYKISSDYYEEINQRTFAYAKDFYNLDWNLSKKIEGDSVEYFLQ